VSHIPADSSQSHLQQLATTYFRQNSAHMQRNISFKQCINSEIKIEGMPPLLFFSVFSCIFSFAFSALGGSVAEWLACWTQVQKARVQIAVATLSGNSLRQTAHTHCASVHQSAKLVAALLRVAGVTAGLAESNGSLPAGY